MLRRRKFKGIEIAIAWVFALLLFAAAFTGIACALIQGRLSVGLASLGALGIGTLFLLAALRGRPL